MIVNAGANSTDEQIALLVNAINDNLTELRIDVQAQIDQLSNAIDGATFNAVKSVQRGVLTTQTGDNVININPVNPDKCMVIIDSKYTTDNLRLPILLGITETTLTISALYYANSGNTYEISWQLIEFY